MSNPAHGLGRPWKGQRSGQIQADSVHATGDQLDTVKRALVPKHGEAAVLAVTGALVTGYKILSGPLKDGRWGDFGAFDVLVIAALAVPAYVAVLKYIKRDSLNEQAREIVDRLLAEQEQPAEREWREKRGSQAKDGSNRRWELVRFTLSLAFPATAIVFAFESKGNAWPIVTAGIAGSLLWPAWSFIWWLRTRSVGTSPAAGSGQPVPPPPPPLPASPP